jgi:hypothetical protein
VSTVRFFQKFYLMIEDVLLVKSVFNYESGGNVPSNNVFC